ncbi:MAG: hypothetical protein ACOC9I_01850, partial [Actinomycetota bacterium]
MTRPSSAAATDAQPDAPTDVQTSVPIDLREPGQPRIEDLTVPAGWQPIATLAAAVLADLDELIAEVAELVEAEVEAYTSGIVPRADLEASIRTNLRAALIGLAENRGPTAAELEVRREAGTRRALQGMPIDALIAAYHVGYRELWHALVDHVPADDAATATQLLGAATTVWR